MPLRIVYRAVSADDVPTIAPLTRASNITQQPSQHMDVAAHTTSVHRSAAEYTAHIEEKARDNLRKGMVDGAPEDSAQKHVVLLYVVRLWSPTIRLRVETINT